MYSTGGLTLKVRGFFFGPAPTELSNVFVTVIWSRYKVNCHVCHTPQTSATVSETAVRAQV